MVTAKSVLNMERYPDDLSPLKYWRREVCLPLGPKQTVRKMDRLFYKAAGGSPEVLFCRIKAGQEFKGGL